MSATETNVSTEQVYQVYIRATPQRIWDAITDPKWNERYGYAAPTHYELRPGGSFKALASKGMLEYGAPDVVVEGEVIEADPPRKLVQTWHPLWDPAITAERPTRLTWEIEEGEGGVSKLTVTQDVEGAPLTAAMVAGKVENAGGGWPFVLSDLKTLLETGASLANG